jgi:hypothetical protein
MEMDALLHEGGVLFYQRKRHDDGIYECDYMIAMGSDPLRARPKYTLNADLTMGSTGADVTARQECLQYPMPNVVSRQPLRAN